MLPGLVIGIAMLQGFRAMGLRDVYASLLIAHVVITLPYVVRTVLGRALAVRLLADRRGAHARLLLSAGAAASVLVPALAPAFLTSGMFAFLASMDNYPISIFFTDAWTKTLPIQMLQYVEERPDPDHRRDLGRPDPARRRRAGDRRPAGRPAQARGLLELG